MQLLLVLGITCLVIAGYVIFLNVIEGSDGDDH